MVNLAFSMSSDQRVTTFMSHIVDDFFQQTFVHVNTATVFMKSICINLYDFMLPNLSQKNVLRYVL